MRTQQLSKGFARVAIVVCGVMFLGGAPAAAGGFGQTATRTQAGKGAESRVARVALPSASPAHDAGESRCGSEATHVGAGADTSETGRQALPESTAARSVQVRNLTLDKSVQVRR